jgi:hypothetical protein
VTLRRLVAVLRLYRLTLQHRAHEAHEEGRACCALALWHVGQDLSAFEQRLREEPEWRSTPPR